MGQTGAGAHKEGIETVVVLQLFNVVELADDGVHFKFHAQLTDVVDLVLHDVLWQTEFRNAVHEHAARGVERFKHSDIVAHLCQIACAGQPRRTGADNSDLLAVLFRQHGCFVRLGAVPVGDETFETADGDRFSLDTKDALAFALVFLWADAAANGRQTGVLFQTLGRFGEIAFRQGGDEIRNIHMHRAAFHTAWFGAMQAALGLGDRRFRAVAQGHFVEIGDANLRVLYRHVVSRCFAGH